MPDLVLLRSFLTTAEAGGVTLAARRLFVTQPALSRRLQQFEAEMGVKLFERSSKGVVLTEEGRFVQAEGENLVRRFEQMRAGAHALTNMEVGTVRIGGGATAVAALLPTAIADFQKSMPSVVFQVQEAGSREIERDVAAERLELGIVTLPIDPSLAAEFEVTRLAADHIVLVAAAAHPFAKKKRIRAAHLEGQDLIGFEAPSAIRKLIDDALFDAGVHVNVTMELRSIPTILRMVTTTGKLAFVSRLAIGDKPEHSGIHTVRITGLSITRELAIIRRKDRPLSPAAAAFVKLLRRKR